MIHSSVFFEILANAYCLIQQLMTKPPPIFFTESILHCQFKDFSYFVSNIFWKIKLKRRNLRLNNLLMRIIFWITSDFSSKSLWLWFKWEDIYLYMNINVFMICYSNLSFFVSKCFQTNHSSVPYWLLILNVYTWHMGFFCSSKALLQMKKNIHTMHESRSDPNVRVRSIKISYIFLIVDQLFHVLSCIFVAILIDGSQ